MSRRGEPMTRTRRVRLLPVEEGALYIQQGVGPASEKVEIRLR